MHTALRDFWFHLFPLPGFRLRSNGEHKTGVEAGIVPLCNFCDFVPVEVDGYCEECTLDRCIR